MFGELFGRYLVGENVIEESTLTTLLKEQSETRVKLGMMAVAEGLITDAQATEINHRQQKEDKRFGDIAIETGALTNAQLDDLLARQGSPYMRFIQILVDETGVEASDIDGYLEDFRKKEGFDQAELDAIKEENVGGYISAFASSSQPLISNIAGQVLRNMICHERLLYRAPAPGQRSSLPYPGCPAQSRGSLYLYRFTFRGRRRCVYPYG